MKTVEEIGALLEIAYSIRDNTSRFNAETRANAEGTIEALEWVLGNTDPPFSPEDVE